MNMTRNWRLYAVGCVLYCILLAVGIISIHNGVDPLASIAILFFAFLFLGIEHLFGYCLRPAQVTLLKEIDAKAKARIRYINIITGVLFSATGAIAIWSAFAGVGFDLSSVIYMKLYACIYPGTRIIAVNHPLISTLLVPASIYSLSWAIFKFIARITAGKYIDIWREYCRYGRSRRKADTLVALASISCVLVVMLTILNFNCYLRITDKGVATNGFWTLQEKFYKWNEIRDIQPGYDTYRFEFTNGSTFTMPDTWEDSDQTIDTIVKRKLNKQSHKN